MLKIKSNNESPKAGSKAASKGGFGFKQKNKLKIQPALKNTEEEQDQGKVQGYKMENTAKMGAEHKNGGDAAKNHNEQMSIRMRINSAKHYTEAARIQEVIHLHSNLEYNQADQDGDHFDHDEDALDEIDH